MNIQYCSDLHLEFPENRKFLLANPLKPAADILILAGDILLFKSIESNAWFFDMISSNFEVTYWLPGNHEYYNFDLADKTGSFDEKIRENIFLVNNHTAHHNDTRLIFSTLWSKISKARASQIQRGINDFYQIRFKGNYLTAGDFNNLHLEAKEYIKSELEKGGTRNTIVITHHVPTLLNYPEQYKSSILNEAFASELRGTIEQSGANYWVYGHHHFNIPEFIVGKTRMVTNQLGYVSHNEHALFNNQALITI